MKNNHESLVANSNKFENQKTIDSAVLESVDENYIKEVISNLHITAGGPIVLSEEEIKTEGLLPKYMTVVGDREIALSLPYNLGHGRVAVLAYVNSKTSNIPPQDFYIARSYYRSNSHGVWRYIPDYGMDGSYGKGRNAESLNLPITLQKALSDDLRLNGAAEVFKPDSIFLGTIGLARTTYYGTAESQNDYYFDVKSEPERLIGKFYGSRHNKTAPEALVLKYEAPDFSKKLMEWDDKSEVQGHYHVDVFPSKDGKFNFMFCKNDKGQVWIGGVEVAKSKVTSTGLKADWAYGGYLTTPIMEYPQEVGDYSGEYLGNGYVDMFENYLSKIPVIQEYLKSVKDRSENK
ncbi:MAG: hypothetical protein HY226_05295 [Candidatus Vogelbacteria bacterium]|nr:hypothetical protein [Candidatus Vogelbacteria bacterium]